MEKSEFEKLVMRVRPAMLDLCRGFLNANRLSVDPEDVVQDALLRLWGMKDRLQTESQERFFQIQSCPFLYLVIFLQNYSLLRIFKY